MPLYALHCHACDHRFETFAYASNRHLIACPNCEASHVENDYVAEAAKPERTWGAKEGTSMSLRFDPKGIDELKREIPDIELDERGYVRFRNDRHQRSVLKQIEKLRKQYTEEAEEDAASATTRS